MEAVILTALGVGGATVLGAVIGFTARKSAARFGAVILSFAAGVMLLSAITGLIMPAVDILGKGNALGAVIWMFAGGFCVMLPESLFPSLCKRETDSREKSRAMLTVLAIALHNLPEGIAAGVGAVSGDSKTAAFVAIGIALQNLPEGCVVVSSLVGAGVSSKKAFLLSVFTAIIEVFGALTAYLASKISMAILPYALSFASGAMLYVIVCEIMAEVTRDERRAEILASFLVGMGIMILMM